MTNIQDLRKKSDTELVDVVQGGRQAVREEHFKDKFSRKAATIRNAKKDIARALTELSARRRNQETK